MWQYLVKGIGLLSCIGLLQASDPLQAIEDKLKQKMPALAIERIQKTPIPEWYQVNEGPGLFYVHQNGQYAFQGELIALAEKPENLSEKARTQFRQETLKKADLSQGIWFKAPAEKMRLYVFTDIDCPHCRHFHQEIDALNQKGVTVVYLAFPRAGIQSSTGERSGSIWCHSNQIQAYVDVIAGQTIGAKSNCQAVADHFGLGVQLGVRVTPTLITDQGELIEGGHPAAVLLKHWHL